MRAPGRLTLTVTEDSVNDQEHNPLCIVQRRMEGQDAITASIDARRGSVRAE
jgi:hypothetical protein